MTTGGEVLLALYLALATIVLHYAIRSVRSNRPALVVFLGFVFFYLILRGLMLLTDTYGVFGVLHGGRSFDPASLGKVFLLSSLSIAAVLFGYGQFSASSFDATAMRKMPAAKETQAFVLVWLASIVMLLLVPLSRNLNWAFSFVVLGGLFAMLYRPAHYPRFVFVLTGAAVIVFALGRTVERRDWAIAVASFALLAIMRQSRKTLRLTLFSLVAVATIAFVAIMLRTGDTLSIDNTLNRLGSGALLPIVEVELDFPLVYDDLVIMFENVPENVEHTYGLHFAKPAYSWVSRDIWPEKPDTISRYYAEVFNPRFHAYGGSEPITFVGELYWNFSFMGLVVAIFVGTMIRKIDDYWLSSEHLLQKTNAIVLATMTFYLLRGPMDTFWLAFAFFFIAWLGVSTVEQVLKNTAE